MHLFAGIGGGLLADLILGHTPVVAVEWEPYACRVLRERAAEGWFPGLHVWEGDVRLFNPSEYTGSVDCIHAGFPCQDISVAGKQAGVSEGTRSGLYREVLRIACVVRPRFLFLENVSAILSNGLGTVLGDLAALGYDARWICIRASDVGAPHQRDRWFLLADANTSRGNKDSSMRKLWASWTEQPSFDTWFANEEETEQGQNGHGWWEIDPADMDDANGIRGIGLRQQMGGVGEIGQGGGNPTPDGNTSVKRNTANGAGATEPGLGRVANGVPNRVGQLKGYGNAQVPLQAAAAYRLLGGI